MKYIIWTLNRASTVLHNHKFSIVDIFQQQGMQCEFADKSKIYDVNHLSQSSIPHQLMEEKTSQFDEYYIPIPIKCLGRWVNQGQAPRGTDKVVLNEIKRNYEYFRNLNSQYYWKKYWEQNNYIWAEDTSSVLAPNLKMSTPSYLGYYELLYKYSNLSEFSGQEVKHILIGYSQGGLVARYLAYLDEYVFRQNIIAAIFTVASPNYGSPVANPSQSDELAEGLSAAIISLLSLTKEVKTNIAQNLLSIFKGFDLSGETTISLISYIEKIILTLEASLQQEQDSNIYGRILSRLELLKTARKWMTGMIPIDLPTAFNDLNTENLKLDISKKPQFPYSVLSLVNSYPHKEILYGYLANTDNSVINIINSIELMGLDLNNIATILNGAAFFTSGSMKDSISNILKFIDIFKIITQELTDIYRMKIMNEEHRLNSYNLDLHHDFPNLAYSRLFQITAPNSLAGYRRIAGPTREILPMSHDFIIPSGYQTLPESNLSIFNQTMHTNHETGGQEKNASHFIDIFQCFVNFKKGIKAELNSEFPRHNFQDFTPSIIKHNLPWFKKKLSNSNYYRLELKINGGIKEDKQVQRNLDLSNDSKSGLWRLTNNGLLQIIVHSKNAFYVLSCLLLPNLETKTIVENNINLYLLGKGFEYTIPCDDIDDIRNVFVFLDYQNQQYFRDKEMEKFELYHA